jgi:hypothetical protein
VTIRPVPGPWRVPPPFRPRYVDTVADEVTYTAQCDRCGRDAAWTEAQGRRPAHLHVHLQACRRRVPRESPAPTSPTC